MTASSTRTRPQIQRTRGGLKVVSGLVVALLAAWVLFASINIVSPSQGASQTRSDAVVSLAPQAHRLPLAEQLVAEDVADTLVISYFRDDVSGGGSGAAADPVPVSDYCASGGREGIKCFTSEETTTIGEAYSVREMVSAESWDSLTVVIDQYHAFRTRFIFEQCLGDEVDVNVVFSDRDLNVAQWGYHLVYENAAFVKAALQTAVRC
ncbi:MAG: hypothetical protein L0K38_13215 [Yaniella sp.]|uniref:hypothetical protein n=1 Tax=Yaniella sp. TaxID=2773929 RepID=UPI002647525A|nr:hypothetical protein [Yaniella sp.]MDN6358635.1 hypothetical protein [Yaniella sp.]MDN6457981.1 hypothetical protein [Yaniella sp.]